jgi:hypothetical protein
MGVQSIRTAIKPRNPTRDRFLGLAVEMSLGKVNRIAELNHVTKEIGTMTEAFQNAGHLLAARLGAPLVVDLGYFTRCITVFDEFDLSFVVRHGHGRFAMNSLGIYHDERTKASTTGWSESRAPGVHLLVCA